jgi:hypothetical protein
MKEFFLFIPLYILGAISDWYGKKYVGEQFEDSTFDIVKPFDIDEWNEQHMSEEDIKTEYSYAAERYRDRKGS